MDNQFDFASAFNYIIHVYDFDRDTLEAAYQVIHDLVWPLCKTGKDEEDTFHEFIMESMIGMDDNWFPGKQYTPQSLADVWDSIPVDEEA